MASDVSTPGDEYRRLADKWMLPRTLVAGESAMKLAGVRYLPQEPKETAKAYAVRLARSSFFNAFGKTVKDMTGRVFDKPVVLEDDVPKALRDYAENIDNAGRHINVFARDAFFDSMQPGIGFILTEMPPALTAGTGRNGEVTRADEQNANRRPYLCFIRAEDVIGWRSQVVNGVVTLTQVRIKEIATEQNGPWHTGSIPQIRVLEPGRWEIWREAVEGPEKGKWVKFSNGVTSVNKITIAPIYMNRVGFMEGLPPLEDLANLNVTHWQKQSDLNHLAHVVNVPILFGAGIPSEETEIEIGANSAIMATDANAKLQYVTHDGAAIGVTRDLLKDTEFQMQAMGLQLLVPQPGGKTATGENRDDVKERAPLAMMAVALQDALEMSFGFMAEYQGLGADAGGSININKDFGVSLNAVELQVLLDMVNSGQITKETFWAEMQRRGLLSDSFDPEVEKDKLASEAPALDAGPGKGMDLNQ